MKREFVYAEETKTIQQLEGLNATTTCLDREAKLKQYIKKNPWNYPCILQWIYMLKTNRRNFFLEYDGIVVDI